MLLIEETNIQLAYHDSALITVYLYIGGSAYELSNNETAYFKVTQNLPEPILLKECTKETASKLLIEITHEDSILFNVGQYYYDLYVINDTDQYTIIRNGSFQVF